MTELNLSGAGFLDRDMNGKQAVAACVCLHVVQIGVVTQAKGQRVFKIDNSVGVALFTLFACCLLPRACAGLSSIPCALDDEVVGLH